MQQNYSKRLEMQIPQENTYIGLPKTQPMDNELERLSKDYTIRKIKELKEYLKKDERLIPYIHSITPTINKYFPNNQKVLTYYIDPEYKELNRAMICVIGIDDLFEEEHELMNYLKKEIIHSTEYPVEVKSLISVRMWWL